ncbi:fluoride efflux transporter CrcB [Flavobacterium sp. j3]|uniref:Fluoride-specific ion channel FluC n=1 Tax=Flavobacterium aureirubrum TaxID=3133147 RepID=A0ABU9N2W3_9FLAO
MLKTILFIAIGGAIGSVLRFLTTVLVSKFYSNHFPLATFMVNVIGCFLIGILMGFLTKNALDNSNLKYFLVTGFCGGFTTFSAFGIENVTLLQNNNTILAFAYMAVSILLSLFAVWLGLFVAK